MMTVKIPYVRYALVNVIATFFLKRFDVSSRLAVRSEVLQAHIQLDPEHFESRLLGWSLCPRGI
jgi:hypothetical protein